MTEPIEEGKSNLCEFCLDAGKFYGYISPDFVLIDCSCGHEDNPIKTKDDPRWKEFQRRWASMNGNVKQWSIPTFWEPERRNEENSIRESVGL